MTKNNALYFAALAFSLGWLFYNFQALNAPVDCGDGLMHFFISQASWEDPSYFLDHWGKPLFTLLSSPFAQFGFGGMMVFNSFVFVFTVFVGWKILAKFNTPLAFQLTLPFLLLLTPDYANNILGGLTEPLFGLFLVLACWTWLEDRFLHFAFFAGATLFLRSEGQLVVLFAFGLLLVTRQWKSIVFLFVPFLLYALIGFFALGDFWWYFTRSPYSMANSFYGVGNYWHYFNEYKAYVGVHGISILLLGLVGLLSQFFKKQLDFKTIGFGILAFGTFFGIVAAHSYFYGSGQNGSMGLTRIATQGLPAFLIVNLSFIGAIPYFQAKKDEIWSFAIPTLFVFLLCTTPYLEKGENRINNALLSTGAFIKNQAVLKNKAVYAYHPLLAYALQSNLKMKNQQLQQFSGEAFLTDKSRLNFGDVIVWDSQFGPYEISIPFDRFLTDPNLMLCHQEIIPGDLGANGVFLFQYVPSEIKKNSAIRLEEKVLLSEKEFSSNKEFQDVLQLPVSQENYSLKVQCFGANNLHFVCVAKDNSDYQAFDLHSAILQFVFSVKKDVSHALYIWNPEKTNYKLTLKRVSEQRVKLPKLWYNEQN